MKAKRNVLLICVDQMRYDTPGYAGNTNCSTPILNEFASSGVSFSQARTPCSLCTPARASMFTGDYAFTHGMGTNCDMYHALSAELKNPERLLHRPLMDEGYRCGYIGKWHVGKDLGPCDYGFEGMNMPGYGDIIHDPKFIDYQKEKGYDYSLTNCIYGNENEQTLLAGCWRGPTESTPSHYLTERTIHLMEQYAKEDDPFLLTCQFWGPHMPHLPSEEFYGYHDRSKIKEWVNAHDDWKNKPGIVKRLGTDFYRTAPKTADQWAELIGCYYDFTSMIDFEVGRILDALKRLNLSDNTLICFTSDHGDMTGSHGGLLDKGFMYDEAHRIPLILSGPDIPSNVSCDDLVSNIDVFPTILDYLGIEIDQRDGRSLLSCLNGEGVFRDHFYMEFHGLRFLYSQRALVTDKGMKYIFTPGDIDELYNLNEDPGELHNLIDAMEYQTEKEHLQQLMIEDSFRYKDPLSSCIAKLFGRWDIADNQPNPTRL